MQAKRTAWQAERDAKAAEEAALRAAIPPAPPGPEALALEVKQEQHEKESEEDEEEEEVPEAPGIQLPSQGTSQGKGKKKGDQRKKGQSKGKASPKAKAKGKGGPKSPFRAEAARRFARIPGPSTSAASSSTACPAAALNFLTETNAASTADGEGTPPASEAQTEAGSTSSKRKRLTPRSKLFTKARGYRETVKVKKVLEEGTLWEREIW